MKKLIFLFGLFAFGCHSPVKAEFAPPQMVPVERLIKSAQVYLDKHPDDAEAHYTMGRIYYLAFSMKRLKIPGFLSYDENTMSRTIPDFMRDWGPNNGNEQEVETDAAVLLSYADHAKQEFQKAIKLDSKQKSLYVLGLASLIDETRQWVKPGNILNLPPDFQNIPLSEVRQLYAMAFYGALPHEEKGFLPPSGLDGLISYEAGKALVRLAAEKNFSGNEEKDATSAKEAISRLEKLPMGSITPIVFSFTPGRHLSQFLAPENIVDFDLRGYGFRDRWTWVKPELGFLVWDPKREGKITSARQLFGSYTFQIFRKTGYDALAALDDNGDGVLSGEELNGISVWFDRNHNGVSDPGEVMPVEELGIRAIAVTATGRDGIHPTNARGIILADGTALRTWDWITMPVPASTPMKLALANSR
jgi:hypothetical protein